MDERRRQLDCAAKIINNFFDSWYWFDAALKRLEAEIDAIPEAASVLAQQESYPIDVAGEIEAIRQQIKSFRLKLNRSKEGARWAVGRPASQTSTDLPLGEKEKLEQCDERLVFLTHFLEDAATQIAADLNRRLNDRSDPLNDYEIEVELDFQLSEGDPGFDDYNDNTVARLSVDTTMNDAHEVKLAGLDWPDGYDRDPMPHGLLFHELRYDTRDMHTEPLPPPRLTDLLRIGDVFVDLVVRHQYSFNLQHGTWTKPSDC